jgi:cytochrome oxidase Cu insertion factor (SCO1/SenC/PrrC family)
MNTENKLIAEFMGVNIITIDDVRKNKNPYFSSADGYLEDDIKYHSSWDWLMPVVEKIENFGFEFFIVEDRVKIAHNTDHSIDVIIDFTSGRRKNETAYQAVVEFIKWYNENLKRNN